MLNDADELTNEEYKIRKGAVKQRVKRCRSSQMRNEEHVEPERNVSAVSESDQSTTSAALEFSPLLVQMNFPKRGAHRKSGEKTFRGTTLRVKKRLVLKLLLRKRKTQH